MLFGEVYAAAGPVLAIHIWASIFVFLGVASGKWFVAENRQMLSFQRAMLGAVVNVILNFLLIPGFGPVGAAIATIVSYSMSAFFTDFLHQETKQLFYMKVSALNIISFLWRAKCSRN
jgi:O-antigen/teichoic acid export membrane protein